MRLVSRVHCREIGDISEVYRGAKDQRRVRPSFSEHGVKIRQHAGGMNIYRTIDQLAEAKMELGWLTEAQALYRAEGYREVARFGDNPYAHHWFAKEL